MKPGNPLRRRAGLRLAAAAPGCAAALACALAPGSALAAVGPPGAGALSPRLAELARPGVRSAPPAKQAQALSLAAEGPGSLAREGNRVVVEVRFDHGAAAAVEDLRQAGAEVVNVSRRYQTVTVAAKPEELRALNGVPRVAGAREVLKPATASTCPSGAVVSEGVRQLHAGEAEGEARDSSTFGVNGSGVTVGILSDSFNRATEAATHAPEDAADGDLPGAGNTCGQTTPVTLVGGDPNTEGEDEGRAMTQIVHDVAPGSNLAFATAFTPSMLGFAENIERLSEPGGPEADVIADDVAFFEEPFFQEGPVADAVRKVTGEGVTYLSAAGNDNLFDSAGNEIASWEARQFRDAGSCPPALVAFSQKLEATEGFGLNPTHCMDFNPGAGVDKTFGIKVAPHATLSIDLQWAEPWNGVGTDIDAYLLNSTGGLIGGSAEDNVNGSQMPFELVQWENEGSSTQTVQLVLNRYAGGLPRLKFALLENGSGVTGTEYPRSSGTDTVGPVVFGHSGSADAISVGAVPYDDSSTVEPYSSRGPVTHYFGPVDGSGPAAALSTPETLAKPDVVATDCGVTSFFALREGAVWRFCGTSAAAPHAAGVAALMLAAEPASPGEVRAGLLAGAVPVGGCAAGAGLVEAVGAIEALLAHASPAGPACAPPGPEVSVEEARAPGDWGSEAPPSEPAEATQGNPAPSSQATDAGPKPAPRTFFRKRPPKVVLTRRRSVKWAFAFGSDQAGVTFLCMVDRGRFHGCRGWFVRHYRLGRHVLRVKARNSAGATDSTPAVYRFRVKRVRRGVVKRRHKAARRRHQRHRHRG
jgi:hypothetical protein